MFVVQYVIKVLCIIHFAPYGSDAQQRDRKYVEFHREFSGNYFAGHGQFPWVVEIRTQASQNQSQQEEWSIGNLIGPRYVLTTCNAVAFFTTLGEAKDRYIVKPKPAKNYKVMYSPDYPYHGPKWWISRYSSWRSYSTELKTGTREILRMTPHPFCSPLQLRYFWGMVEIGSEPIRPFRLFVNYAPGDLDANSLYKRWSKIHTQSSWNPPLLSTWGRDYFDRTLTPTMLRNFKLRYRVTEVTWGECLKVKDKLAWSYYSRDMSAVKNHTYCMQVHDIQYSVVSVCDHDRGAPIVSDGYFVGMVVSAAKFNSCSMLEPLPFVVLTIEDAQLYWTNVERHILQYFIDNSSHIFPGLTGLIVDPEGRGVSPPPTTSAPIVWTTVGLLLLLFFAIC
ncbi:hypothetical protein GE061_012715 [Apolygus lucorum]|uniref:Peptidase S1 domain-containing protein n=1 Tax=Apolygus lucorum TaxID=248454 RepID=A0A6A4JCG7_APOLU|nr:hypothetical protein GE061_012715 [Apolygus lucorum]